MKQASILALDAKYELLTRDTVVDSVNEIIVVPATRTMRGIATEVVLTADDGIPAACALNFDHVSRRDRIGGFALRGHANGATPTSETPSSLVTHT